MLTKSGKVVMTEGRDPKAHARLMSWRGLVGAAAMQATESWPHFAKKVPLQLTVSFMEPRPKNQFRGKSGEVRDDAPDYPAKTPDVDKLVRAIGDSIKGIVYHDDSQIVLLVAEKTYGSAHLTTITVDEMPKGGGEKAARLFEMFASVQGN